MITATLLIALTCIITTTIATQCPEVPELPSPIYMVNAFIDDVFKTLDSSNAQEDIHVAKFVHNDSKGHFKIIIEARDTRTRTVNKYIGVEAELTTTDVPRKPRIVRFLQSTVIDDVERLLNVSLGQTQNLKCPDLKADFLGYYKTNTFVADWMNRNIQNSELEASKEKTEALTRSKEKLEKENSGLKDQIEILIDNITELQLQSRKAQPDLTSTLRPSSISEDIELVKRIDKLETKLKDARATNDELNLKLVAKNRSIKECRKLTPGISNFAPNICKAEINAELEKQRAVYDKDLKDLVSYYTSYVDQIKSDVEQQKQLLVAMQTTLNEMVTKRDFSDPIRRGKTSVNETKSAEHKIMTPGPTISNDRMYLKKTAKRDPRYKRNGSKSGKNAAGDHYPLPKAVNVSEKYRDFAASSRIELISEIQLMLIQARIRLEYTRRRSSDNDQYNTEKQHIEDFVSSLNDEQKGLLDDYIASLASRHNVAPLELNTLNFKQIRTLLRELRTKQEDLLSKQELLPSRPVKRNSLNGRLVKHSD